MERISKKISLVNYISRVPSPLPYKQWEKDEPADANYSNWGKYPFDVLGDNTGIKFLEGKVWSFRELTDLFNKFKKLIYEADYYHKIKKNGKLVWSKTYLSFYEKDEVNVKTALPDVNEYADEYVGVGDMDIDEIGGIETLLFLYSIMGLFKIPKKFIKKYNLVPEYMYYSGIDSYINNMNKYSNSENCCLVNKYAEYGGDEFKDFLEDKKYDGRKNARDVRKYVSKNGYPSLSISILLTNNNKTVGQYTQCEEYGDGNCNTSNEEYKISAEEKSKLHRLRNKKVCYDDITPGLAINEVIIDYVYDKAKREYKLVALSPYETNKLLNINTTIDGVYGDMILSITPDNREMECEIIYVINGKFEESEGKYSYIEGTGKVYNEKREIDYVDLTEKPYTLSIGEYPNVFAEGVIPELSNFMVIDDSEDIMSNVEETMHGNNDMKNYPIISEEYNFGKTLIEVNNTDEIYINRGYSNAFELFNKLGEVNTFEDLQNYQNNYFKLK